MHIIVGIINLLFSSIFLGVGIVITLSLTHYEWKRNFTRREEKKIY